jgi:hypothetical protein
MRRGGGFFWAGACLWGHGQSRRRRRLRKPKAAAKASCGAHSRCLSCQREVSAPLRGGATGWDGPRRIRSSVRHGAAIGPAEAEPVCIPPWDERRMKSGGQPPGPCRRASWTAGRRQCWLARRRWVARPAGYVSQHRTGQDRTGHIRIGGRSRPTTAHLLVSRLLAWCRCACVCVRARVCDIVRVAPRWGLVRTYVRSYHVLVRTYMLSVSLQWTMCAVLRRGFPLHPPPGKSKLTLPSGWIQQPVTIAIGAVNNTVAELLAMPSMNATHAWRMSNTQ